MRKWSQEGRHLGSWARSKPLMIPCLIRCSSKHVQVGASDGESVTLSGQQWGFPAPEL